jgi:hypothetical protein
MPRDVPAFDAMDDELQARVDQTRERYVQDPTPENRAAYKHAVRVFAEWVLYGKRPEASDLGRTAG